MVTTILFFQRVNIVLHNDADKQPGFFWALFDFHKMNFLFYMGNLRHDIIRKHIC